MYLHKKIILQKRKLAIFSTITFFFIVFTYHSYFYLLQDNKELKSELGYLEFQNEKITQEAEIYLVKESEYMGAQELWQNINELSTTDSGIDLEKANVLLQDLKVFYLLSDDFMATLSPKIYLKDIFFNENKILVSSNIKLKNSAYTDEIFLRFVDSLDRNFPGFLKFKQLKLRKLSELDSNLIIEAEQGRPTYLVEGEIEADWHDFEISK